MQGIQVLRYVAALLVVIMHSHQAWNGRLGIEHYWGWGSVGVDIFFVISGFVMMHSTATNKENFVGRSRSAWIFIKRRVIRIVPLYWIYTLVKLTLVLVVPSLAIRTSVDPVHVLSSFLFFPFQSPWGNYEPFLPVGWTLNFEMLFYVVFAAAICAGLNRILFCFGVFFLIILLSRYSDLGFVRFYATSIIFEFLLGCSLALLVPRLRSMPFRFYIGIFAIIFALIYFLAIYELKSFDRLIGWGLPSAILVFGFLCIELKVASISSFALLKKLGDSSYSIYLAHTFVVPAIIIIFAKTSVTSLFVFMLCSIFLSSMAGLISYKLLEQPLLSFLKRYV